METTNIKIANQLEKEKIIRRINKKYRKDFYSACFLSVLFMLIFIVCAPLIVGELKWIEYVLGTIIFGAIPLLISFVFHGPGYFFHTRKLRKQVFYYYPAEFSCKDFMYQQEVQLTNERDIIARRQLKKKSKEEWKAHQKNPRICQACLTTPVVNERGEEMFYGEDRNWVPVDGTTFGALQIKRDTPMYVVIYGKKVIGFMREELELSEPQEAEQKNGLGGMVVEGNTLKRYQDTIIEVQKTVIVQWVKWVSVFVGVLLSVGVITYFLDPNTEKQLFVYWGLLCVGFGMTCVIMFYLYIRFCYDYKSLKEFLACNRAYEVDATVKQLIKVFPCDWDSAPDTEDARLNLFMIVEDNEGNELPEVLCRPVLPVNQSIFEKEKEYKLGQKVKLLYTKDRGKGQKVIIFK